MEWIKINNPPKYNWDTLLFPKSCSMRHDCTIRAFYERDGFWYDDRGNKIEDVFEKYSHWLDMTPPEDYEKDWRSMKNIEL